MNNNDAGNMLARAHKTAGHIVEIKGVHRNKMKMPVKTDQAEQVSNNMGLGELKDFQRQETVYEEIQNKGDEESGDKAIKTIGVILAALIWLLLVLFNNPSHPGPGYILSHLLHAGFIFSIATLIILKILRKQE